jgi:hypothetical protein
MHNVRFGTVRSSKGCNNHNKSSNSHGGTCHLPNE